MKISLIAVTMMLPVGFALAQKAPGNTSAPPAQSQSTSSKTSTEKAGTTNELKTQTYKGTLVDASCAGGAGPSTSTKSSTQSAADRNAEKSATTGEANRSGSESCGATSSTNQFGLRMKDGSTMKFDAVGNERAKEAIATRKKWSDAIAAGKPVQVSVSGTESGNQLTVVSIH
jgi:hypothetical protein